MRKTWIDVYGYEFSVIHDGGRALFIGGIVADQKTGLEILAAIKQGAVELGWIPESAESGAIQDLAATNYSLGSKLEDHKAYIRKLEGHIHAIAAMIGSVSDNEFTLDKLTTIKNFVEHAKAQGEHEK